MRHLAIARSLFPFEHQFRSALADYHSEVRWKGSREPAIAALKEALKTDPNNAGMHRNLAGFYIEDGDIKAASAEIMVVRRLVPMAGQELGIRVNVNPDTGGKSALLK